MSLKFPVAAALILAMAQASAQTNTGTTAATVDSATEMAAETRLAAPTGTLIVAEAVEDATVYSLADAYDRSFWDSGDPFGPVAADWNEIGQVEALVIDGQARVVGVTVEIGGFLGIGETTILIPVEDLRLVQLPDDEGFYIVTRLSRADLEAAEALDEDLLIGD